ncbi:MAG: DinB family protein [Fimbriimonadaceae bacterium]|nr:DinB family protein [Fimbriimonadaceae bacterium]QYK55556.1 MAG: DinB family protein [Fimbriimonadaceae bacterium]
MNVQSECLVEFCKKSAVAGMEEFLRVFKYVPDDKLHWTPVPTAKSALRVGAHTAVAAGNFARMIRERRVPYGDEIPDFVARTRAEEEAITTREEMESVFRKNTEAVLAALDGLTEEDFAISLDSGQGWSMPMTWMMKLPGTHAFSHHGQIDFLQTCWDDQEIHF